MFESKSLEQPYPRPLSGAEVSELPSALIPARRLGFRFEGVFYNHMIFKGRNRDTAWYSILDDEWPEVRGLLEGWLDERNFSDDGSAKTSLFEMMQDRSPSQRGQ